MLCELPVGGRPLSSTVAKQTNLCNQRLSKGSLVTCMKTGAIS